MKVSFSYSDQTDELDVAEEASDFYTEVGKKLTEVPIPNTVVVSCPFGKMIYDVTTRGGTRLVCKKSGHVNLEQKKPYPERYLVMVNAEHNNYKFYHLKQDTVGGSVLATYGRIGARPGEIYGERNCTYDADMFWTKYYEKTAKGYEDKSDIYLEKPEAEEKVEEKKNTKTKSEDLSKIFTQASVDLYALLKKFANHTVKSSCISMNVTMAMVNESKRLLAILYTTTTVEDFNDKLMDLLAVCPRKVSSVKTLLAKDESDFTYIINREESLINAMEALAYNSSKKPQQNTVEGESFADEGIEVYIATDKQKKQVMDALSDSLKPKVKQVYRIINPAHKKRFDEYLKKNDIKVVKQLWHGSRNENWMSIIRNSLMLNPNAKITGKMFGQGIYFAPKSTKSWNYTSYRNSYWARGDSDTAFMGLYAVAYGNPLDCYTAHSYTKTELKSRNCDCVHAHAGSALMNDEIIFYDEAAMVLNYIVEFGD